MTEFQRSLTRFMYAALALALAVAVWAMVRPARPVGSNVGWGYGQGPGVTARGTCMLRTKPDLVQVSVGVTHSAGSAAEANDFVKARIRKVVDVLKSGGVADRDMQTERLELLPTWDAKRRKMDWRATQSLRVRFRDIQAAPTLIDGAVGVGANRVGNAQYTVENPDRLRAGGRAKAAKVAREKAGQLASLLGGKLGRLLSAEESYHVPYDESANVAMKVYAPSSLAEQASTLQPGEVVEEVRVTATYEVK